ncbi:MAG: hypothetical protein KAS38_07260 [Anaerolineales bacterium]|nr:hypothetical protein [Anaerolineales bacterium]
MVGPRPPAGREAVAAPGRVVCAPTDGGKAPKCPITTPPTDGGSPVVGDVVIPPADGGIVVAGGVGPAPADCGIVAAGGVALAPADGGKFTAGGVALAPAGDGIVAAGGVVNTPADGGIAFANSVAPAPTDGGIVAAGGVIIAPADGPVIRGHLVGEATASPSTNGGAHHASRYAVAAVTANQVGAGTESRVGSIFHPHGAGIVHLELQGLVVGGADKVRPRRGAAVAAQGPRGPTAAPSLQGVMGIRGRGQRLARAEVGVPAAAVDPDLQPARLAVEGVAAKLAVVVQHDAKIAVADRHAVDGIGPQQAAAAGRVIQPEAKITGAVDRAAGIAQAALVSKGRAHGCLGADVPCRLLGLTAVDRQQRQEDYG